jgi:hypothetical protein
MGRGRYFINLPKIYDYHFTNFHQTYKCSVTCHGDIPYRISPQLVKNCLNCWHKFIYVLKQSINVTGSIFPNIQACLKASQTTFCTEFHKNRAEDLVLDTTSHMERERRICDHGSNIKLSFLLRKKTHKNDNTS